VSAEPIGDKRVDLGKLGVQVEHGVLARRVMSIRAPTLAEDLQLLSGCGVGARGERGGVPGR
jgi:hypothetical protein